MSLRSRIREDLLGPGSSHPSFTVMNIRRALLWSGYLVLAAILVIAWALWRDLSDRSLSETVQAISKGNALAIAITVLFSMLVLISSALITYFLALRMASQEGARRNSLDPWFTLGVSVIVIGAAVVAMWFALGVPLSAETRATSLSVIGATTFLGMLLVMYVVEGLDLPTLARAMFGLRSLTALGILASAWWGFSALVLKTPLLNWIMRIPGVSKEFAQGIVPAAALFPMLGLFVWTFKAWLIPAALRTISDSANKSSIDEEFATSGLQRPQTVPLTMDAFPRPTGRLQTTSSAAETATQAMPPGPGSEAAPEEPQPFAESIAAWCKEHFGAALRVSVQRVPVERGCGVANAQDLSVFFGGPPTEDQERFIRRAESTAERAATDPDFSADLLLHGPEGSGRSTALIALAIVACIDRGCRTVLLTPTVRAAELAMAELVARIERMHFREAVLPARIDDSQMLRMVQDKTPRIPDIWVGTPIEFERALFGTRTDKSGTQRLQAILSRMQCVLIDDIDRIEDAVRNHVPFLVEKLRLLLRLAGHSMQVVGVLDNPTSATLRTVTSRILKEGVDQSVALRPPRSEQIELVEVPIRREDDSEEMLRKVAKRLIELGKGIDVLVPGAGRAEIASLETELNAAGGSGQVHPDADAFRLRREVVCAFATFRRFVGERRAIIVHRSSVKEIPLVIALGGAPLPTDDLHLIMLPSHRSVGFAVPHLRSIGRFLKHWVPGHRDLWAKFGLGGPGDLTDLPIASDTKGRGSPEFTLAVDPSELESRAVTASSKEVWPWVSVIHKPEDWSPVDLLGPISTLDRMRMDHRAMLVDAGRTSVDLTRSGSEPLVDWTDDQGQALGTTSLAYGDLLLLKTARGLFYPTEVAPNPIRLRGRKFDGQGNEPIVPVWRSMLRIHEEALLVSQEGGDLARSVARFSLESGRPQPRPDLTLHTMQRMRKRSGDLSNAFEIEAQLEGAVDSHGTIAEFGRIIPCRYPVRGSVWFILKGSDPRSLSDAQRWVKVHASTPPAVSTFAPFAGSWNAPTDDPSRNSEWTGPLWPELAALLHIGLRETIRGWGTLARTMAFRPGGALRERAHAVIFMIEPLPTQGTVNKTLSELCADSPLLNRVLLTSTEAMTRTPAKAAMDRTIQLAIMARCVQRSGEELYDDDSIDAAIHLLSDLRKQLLRISGI